MPNATDTTVYGTGRASPRSFFTHHLVRGLTGAADTDRLHPGALQRRRQRAVDLTGEHHQDDLGRGPIGDA